MRLSLISLLSFGLLISSHALVAQVTLGLQFGTNLAKPRVTTTLNGVKQSRNIPEGNPGFGHAIKGFALMPIQNGSLGAQVGYEQFRYINWFTGFDHIYIQNLSLGISQSGQIYRSLEFFLAGELSYRWARSASGFPVKGASVLKRIHPQGVIGFGWRSTNNTYLRASILVPHLEEVVSVVTGPGLNTQLADQLSVYRLEFGIPLTVF